MLDSVVIGLGAAGCRAASYLSHHEKKIVCLEAQDRIGGRINTINIGDEHVEMGAEWVHGELGNCLVRLALSSGVKLIPQNISYSGFTSDGRETQAEVISDIYREAFRMFDDLPMNPMPLGVYITERLRCYISEHHPEQLEGSKFQSLIRWMNLVFCNYESCPDWNQVTTASQYEELIGHKYLSWHKHGYKAVLDFIMTPEKSRVFGKTQVMLSTEVTLIQWPQHHEEAVVVTCKDGSVYKARSVIYTASLAVLKEQYATLFSPILPVWKVNAIEALSIGVVDKIVLTFEEVWWKTDTSSFAFVWREQELAQVSDEDKWTTMICRATRSLSMEKCLVLWISGDAAKHVETLPEMEVKEKAMGLLRMFMGRDNIITECVEIRRSMWHSNEFIRGSYSFDNLGTPNFPNARQMLAEPLVDSAGKPRIMFAGEATDATHFSTVHGAMDSGLREAERFLNAEYEFNEIVD